MSTSLVEGLKRIDERMARESAKRSHRKLPIVVEPCLLKLYVIEFDNGQRDCYFSAKNDEEALWAVINYLALGHKITVAKFHKKHGRGVFCGDRLIFPLPEKSKKKK